MKKSFIPVPLSILSLCICTQLYAQETSATAEHEAKQQLSPIVMTATRSQKSIADIAGTVYSIDQREIEKQVSAGKNIAEILGHLVPSLTPNSGTTSNYGMTMRGRVVQYLIDGVPQTGSRDGSRQLNSISPAMIERIEIVSGASSIYGSGATGGIINIITKSGGEDALNFESKVGISSQNHLRSDALSYEASQTVLFNQGAVKGSLGANFAQRGEIQDSRGRRVGPEVAQTDRQDTDTVDVSGRLSWDISEQQSLSVGAQYYHDEQDSDYGPDYGSYQGRNLAHLLFATPPSLRAVPGLNLQNQPKTERWSVNAQYQQHDLWGQNLSAEAYYRNEKGRWYPTASPLGNARLDQELAQRYPNLRDPASEDFLNYVRYGYGIVQSNNEIEVAGARLALQKELEVAGKNLGLTYGLDFENEKNKAQVTRYDFNDFYNSNGLQFRPLQQYAFGPDFKNNKLGIYLQNELKLTDRIDVQAGIRHERIDSKVSDSLPYRESIPQDVLNELGVDYQAQPLKGGKIKHNATLFNAGAVYHLTDAQQLFANFSQGFSLPDVQRMLRDVPANFIVTSNNIDPIQVNNYELGWRVQQPGGLQLGLTGFYNDSDKSVKFNGAPNYNLEVIDTDERIYGVEANVRYPVSDSWSVGGTAAYTRGQFKNRFGDWQELDATRVAPLKGTLYSEWQFDDDWSLRVQSLSVGGTDKARRDFIAAEQTSNKAPAAIRGFATMDVIANAKVGPGTLGFGVYNVWNTDYKTVFSQSVEPTYGAISSLAAQGRSYGLSYSLKY